MGRFFSNIQVKCGLSKDEFVEKFKNSLDGYEICGRDEADIIYRAAFSERYATFARLEYHNDPDTLFEDAEMFSEALKTSVFTITAEDSDFAALSLFTDGSQTDDVVVGIGEDYGVEESPAEPTLWQPLLKPGTTFGELAEIWEKNEIFVEDALANSAQLFGIEPQFMLAEFRELNDSDSVLLCFKKKANAAPRKTTKKPDIITAFDTVFEAELSPRGFRRIKKGSFVRVIGSEILPIIEYRNTSSGKKKSFTVCTNMYTVYKPLSAVKERGFFWPVPYLCTIYESSYHPERYEDETFNKMNEICYDPNDSADMIRAAHEALEFTKQLALPQYDLVTDLTSFLKISRGVSENAGWIHNLEKCRDPKALEKAFFELLYVKTRYKGDFLEFLLSEEDYNKMIEAVKARNFEPWEDPYPYHDQPYSKYRDNWVKGAVECREILDKTLADSEFCAIINEELEHRKSENIKTLAELGVEI
ncbi:MAG: hypothetical protein K2N56_06315 [Oscillospiraceae bacterium]|nr:hypothetical protein [Oscillospiraceae bacterium]